MARARRVALFERDIQERISRAAAEVLLERAEILSEGQQTPSGTYYGSTMLTIDLARHAALLREPCDVASARRLATLFARDTRACAWVRGLTEREAHRVAGHKLSRLTVELTFRWQGTRVFVDADVEGGTT
jgi:hypothetical protein